MERLREMGGERNDEAREKEDRESYFQFEITAFQEKLAMH